MKNVKEITQTLDAKKMVVRLFKSDGQETVFINDKKIACDHKIFFDDIMVVVAEAAAKQKPEKLIYDRYSSDLWLIDEKHFDVDPDISTGEIRVVNTLEDYLEYSKKED